MVVGKGLLIAAAIGIVVTSATACSDSGSTQAAPTKAPAAQPSQPGTSPTAFQKPPPLMPKHGGEGGGEGTGPGWPGPGTVGVPSGRKLTPSGPLTVDKKGAVIDGKRVSGEINVVADNVVIRNTQVVGAGDWAIIQRREASGLRVENTEINGDGKVQAQVGILNQGGMLTVRRAKIHTVSNGINTDHGLIEDSLISDLKEFPKDHLTAIQSNSGPAPGLQLVIRRNTLLNAGSQTSAVSIYQDFGRAHDTTVEANILAGGGYALYGGKGRFGASTNIKIIRNVFSRRYHKKGGYWGPVTAFEYGPGNVWEGNVWAETGKPVKP